MLGNAREVARNTGDEWFTFTKKKKSLIEAVKRYSHSVNVGQYLYACNILLACPGIVHHV